MYKIDHNKKKLGKFNNTDYDMLESTYTLEAAQMKPRETLFSNETLLEPGWSVHGIFLSQ